VSTLPICSNCAIEKGTCPRCGTVWGRDKGGVLTGSRVVFRGDPSLHERYLEIADAMRSGDRERLLKLLTRDSAAKARATRP